jgi:tetratricopeptide (TPR) repeat protein
VLFHYAPGARSGQLDTTLPVELSAVTGRLWVVVHPYIGPAEGALINWLAAQPSTVEYRIDQELRVFVVDNSRTRAELLAEIAPPDRALAWVTLAQQYTDLDDLSHAEASYRRALELSNDVGYRVAYAGFLRQAGRDEDAVRWYIDALTTDPNQVSALSGLGRIYFERGLLTEAAAVLERAVVLDSSDYAANYFLWQTYDRLGRTLEAARYRDLAAQLVPDLIEPP